MKKILFVIHSSEQTGAPICVYHLLKSLDKKIFYPIVALPNSGIMERKFKQNKIETHTFNVARFGKKEVFRLAAFILKNGISLVHANSLESYAGCVAARLTFKPVVWHIHEMLDTYISRVRSLLPLATKAVAVSQKSAQAMERFVSSKKIVLIYNGISQDWFQPQPYNHRLREKYGIEPTTSVILSAGSIWPGKGYSYLIEAVKIVLDRIPNTKFLIAGDVLEARYENYKKELLEKRDKLGLRNSVTLLGFIENLKPLLSAADLVVSSSLEESLGLTLIEAMALGKPVVTTEVGGTPEVVIDRNTGFLVPPANPKALAEAILTLLKSPDLVFSFGNAGQKRAREMFSSEVMTKKFESLYKELLQ